MVELHYLTGLNRRRFIFFFYLRSSSWAWTSKNSWAIFAFSSFTARWLPLLGDVGCHNTNLHLIFPAIHAKEIFALLKAVDLDWFMYHWFMAGGPNWFMYQSMNQTIRMCSWFRSDSWSQSRNLELESLSILLGTLDSKYHFGLSLAYVFKVVFLVKQYELENLYTISHKHCSNCDKSIEFLALHSYMYACTLSCSVVSDSLQPRWTVAHQAPLSMEFSRQKCWSRLPFSTPGFFPTQGLKLHWWVDSLPLYHLGIVPWLGQ